MWYHYLIGAIFVYFAFKIIYEQLTSKYSSVFYRIPGLVGLVVDYYILSWCYAGIYPPPMFGGRRY
jgi:hypothetical protein